MTFDDGPHPVFTPRLVKALRRLDVPATFFVLGSRVRKYPGAAAEIRKHGFQVGNHSWGHENFARTPRPKIRRSLTATNRIMHRHKLGDSPVMRAPYGLLTPKARQEVKRAELVPVHWTVDSADWESGNAKQVARRVLGQLRPHRPNIVLQHDGLDQSAASVASVGHIVKQARKRGYCFTDLDDRGRQRAPASWVYLSDATVTEATTGKIALTLNYVPRKKVSVTVQLFADSASGADFVSQPVAVTFGPKQWRKYVPVRALGDQLTERRETITARITDTTGIAAKRATATVIVRDASR